MTSPGQLRQQVLHRGKGPIALEDDRQRSWSAGAHGFQEMNTASGTS